MKTVAVANPTAGAGRVWKNREVIAKFLKEEFGDVSILFTEGPLHATELTREAIGEGANTIVCVGGDGTLNEVINGFFDERDNPREGVKLFVLPAGTGSDFLKSFGIKKGLRKPTGRTVKLDAGLCEYMNKDGKEERRFFINIIDFGIGGEVVRRVNESSKIFGGFFSFLKGSIMGLISYRPAEIVYEIDGRRFEGKPTGVVVANGKFFGGGMKIAPEADPSDGVFDVVILGEMSLLKFLRHGHRVYKGTHIELDEVRVLKGRCVKIEVISGKCPIDMDGEDIGYAPSTVKIVPSAIEMLI